MVIGEAGSRCSGSYVSGNVLSLASLHLLAGCIEEEEDKENRAFEELEGLLAQNNICIAVKEKLVKDSGVAEEGAYDHIVQRLLQKYHARGVIIFGSDQEVAGVMRAVRRNNATGSFSWIGSDGWSARSLVFSDFHVHFFISPHKVSGEYMSHQTIMSLRRFVASPVQLLQTLIGDCVFTVSSG
ncbi:hypothetical protein O3P69_015852 [Scylla paramamosain]|uniref:Receptor ligand binding region domain-containing protein n=1 Tax=Scylla paramamosain TaxID=85552 RepID=A0AAW0T7W4_SCYPA